MIFLNGKETKDKITDFARKSEPFLFIIDASMTRGLVYTPEEAAIHGILFYFNGITNYSAEQKKTPDLHFELFPIPYESYAAAFNKVQFHLNRGDTYLLNLTFPTPIKTNYSLEQIFHTANAPYRLLVKDRFVVFSPEIFIRIRNHTISSFPMKGTIDADLPDAGKILISDEKELFEHNTIVDLIRNDLAMVSDRVAVKRFRYIDRIKTNRKELLQVSSEIIGRLPENYRSELGEILFSLLPAGSVTGAPKTETIRIIHATEKDDRGFYTGICGYYDGSNLDSAVMIRFIESTENGLVFRSGGGITALSDPGDEYKELLDKVYVPVI
jgi:para-aminobenzoate synthetase component I